ncbi:fructoselysine-6-P-deglycase FrlB-like protein [Actinokineospora baliensis]|uniref:SIS domain-containing protein n=1 Tax=Actinokineospora baliensis TaxID=547056 RepID=UPI00195BD64A|nr:SIS domain-containing protein [Actinokineospora baliensis]MBM7772307.1 fructoselysine-6-P-deglycase FrlB-like protein [Actinokineospora baliensis]
MSFVTAEIAGQPACWERAVGQPIAPGERVAVVGCGTSWFIAMAYAALRQATGQWTDAFPASEALVDRGYDRVVAITRSGTTTEVIDLLARAAVPTTVITGVAGSPATQHATETVLLAYADERSVVQTQFATTALAYLRTSLGEDLTQAIADARTVLDQDLGDLASAEQFTFLGQGWTVGLAHEAALKLREAAGLWTESYPAMEYRHGPISIAQPGRVTWVLGQAPHGLRKDVESTGAQYLDSGTLDPMAHLVLAQRVAVAAALRRGLDPDQPRNLTRSVILGA